MKSKRNIIYFCMKYKFTILIVIYLLAVLHFQLINEEKYWYWLNILNTFSLLLYLHLFGRCKFRMFFLIPFSILLSYDAYYGFFFHSNVTHGIIGAIFETTVTEATSVLNGLLPGIILILTITTSLVFLSARELGRSKIRRKYSAIYIGILPFCRHAWLYLFINKIQSTSSDVVSRSAFFCRSTHCQL